MQQHQRQQRGEGSQGQVPRMQRVPVKRRLLRDDEGSQAKKRLNFGASIAHFLLPNGTSVKLELQKGSWEDFGALYHELERKSSGNPGSRAVEWRSDALLIQDESGNPIRELEQLFTGKSTNIFLVQDGGAETSHADQELWNVTPEPEMLERLPDGYNLETALADHVDNALQAVWDNKPGVRRLVSVEINPDSITIFDTGHGMDASENPISRWGTVGASTHRDVHHKGIGGEPPYLKPYLGKYGVGGVAAALHLGKNVEVRSKSATSKKVVSLILTKGEINQDKSRGSGVWRTHGGFHDVTEDEANKSPHGSFTSVKITGLNPEACIKNEQHYWKLERVRRMLKDIYSLYIQCDGPRRTLTSVEFEVNGRNLLEESGGDVTTCNKHSCPGDPFVIHLAFQSGLELAHGRLTCQYFPNKKGRETLEDVVEELNKQQIFSSEKTFSSYPRIGIRWLGRLLPSAQWQSMPFMEAKVKARDQQFWVRRVKIFADLDAGFQPTPTKTNLVESHHFTMALKQLGSNSKTDPEVEVKIQCGHKQVSAPELCAQFKTWLKTMHESFDEDVEFSGETIYVLNHEKSYNKTLGVERTILTFHRKLKDRGGDWEAGDRIFLEKAVSGKKNLYAVIEWFVCDGIAEEHGEVRMICRPMEVQTSDDDDESVMTTEKGVCIFKLNRCKCFSVLYWLNAERCRRVDDAEWTTKLAAAQNKLPSSIEILSNEDRARFSEEPLPSSSVEAGYQLPGYLLAVIRPRLGFGPTFRQSMIVPADSNFKLKLEVSCQESKQSEEQVLSTEPCSGGYRSGIRGLFVFPVKPLTKAGRYTFRVSEVDEPGLNLKPGSWELDVKPLAPERWILRGTEPLRMDAQAEHPLLLEAIDKYENRTSLDKPFPLSLVVEAPEGTIFASLPMKRDSARLSSDSKTLVLHSFFLPGFKLDPSREALVFAVTREQKLAHLMWGVLPGKLAVLRMIDCSEDFDVSPYSIVPDLKPGDVIHRMKFQAEDKYGNLVSNEKLTVKVEGLEPIESERKVDETGYLCLSELRVANQYNATGFISFHLPEDNTEVTRVSFTLARRTLLFGTKPPAKASVGTLVEGLTIHVVDDDGELDTCMSGTLSASWENSVCFRIQQGVCNIQAFEMPREPGLWSGRLWHSTCVNIEMDFQIDVQPDKACRIEQCSDLVVFARCNEAFYVDFKALDALNLPGYLDCSETMEEMCVGVYHETLGTEVDNWEGAQILPVDSKYRLKLRLNGKLGCYRLALLAPSLGLEEITWKVQLAPGPLSRLVPVLPSDDLAAEELLSDVCKDGPGHVSIQRRGLFPNLTVYLLDSNDNICDEYDGEDVALTVPGQASQITQPVRDGCAQFLPFTVDLPVGCYDMEITRGSSAAEDQISCSLPFVVGAGSFPSALRMVLPPPSEVRISNEDLQQLPETRISVESEDEQTLKHPPQVLLSILKPSGEAWECYRGERCGSEFLFQDVLVPTEAGSYTLKFFVCEHRDVPPVFRQLEVLHGEPASLQFSAENRDAGNSLVVDVVDKNRNRCLDLNDVELSARIQAPVSNFQGRDLYRSFVRKGRATFEDFQLDPAIYTLKVSVVDDEMCVPEISASFSALRGQHPRDMRLVLQMLEQQNPHYQSLLQVTRMLQQQLLVKEARNRELHGVQKLRREKLSAIKLRKQEVELQQRIGHDETLLRLEKRQPQITETRVVHMLTVDDDAAAMAVHLALKELPPGFPADEVLGLAFTFARVETKQLNNVLSHYLGEKLLTILCKSARGSSWLEPLDSDGSINKSRGLYAFAERKNLRINGSIHVMCLDGFRRASGPAVDSSHPQKLLMIEAPLLQNGKPPPGFLGFAVNMLHLKPQHVQLRQTCFFEQFEKLQVYDTRKNMLAARAQLPPGFNAVSLDGASCSGFQSELGSMREPRLCFATVPYAEREKVALALPEAAAFWRHAEMQKLVEECKELEEAIEETSREEKANEEAIQGRKERLKVIEVEYLHCKAGAAPHLISDGPQAPPSLLPWQASDPGAQVLQIQLFNS